MHVDKINEKAYSFSGGFSLERSHRYWMFYVETGNVLPVRSDPGIEIHEIFFPTGRDVWVWGPASGKALTQMEVERVRENLAIGLPVLSKNFRLIEARGKVFDPPDVSPRWIWNSADSCTGP